MSTASIDSYLDDEEVENVEADCTIVLDDEALAAPTTGFNASIASIDFHAANVRNRPRLF